MFGGNSKNISILSFPLYKFSTFKFHMLGQPSHFSNPNWYVIYFYEFGHNWTCTVSIVIVKYVPSQLVTKRRDHSRSVQDSSSFFFNFMFTIKRSLDLHVVQYINKPIHALCCTRTCSSVGSYRGGPFPIYKRQRIVEYCVVQEDRERSTAAG